MQLRVVPALVWIPEPVRGCQLPQHAWPASDWYQLLSAVFLLLPRPVPEKTSTRYNRALACRPRLLFAASASFGSPSLALLVGCLPLAEPRLHSISSAAGKPSSSAHFLPLNHVDHHPPPAIHPGARRLQPRQARASTSFARVPSLFDLVCIAIRTTLIPPVSIPDLAQQYRQAVFHTARPSRPDLCRGRQSISITKHGFFDSE